MITKIEALNFRCLRYVNRPLGAFHVLVGPNASGKTTFLDVVAFLGDLVSDGLDAAVSNRTQNFEDLLWRRGGLSEAVTSQAGGITATLRVNPTDPVPKHFELAIEASIPLSLREKLAVSSHDTIRYEISLGVDSDFHEMGILAEKVLLKVNTPRVQEQKVLFPVDISPPSSILTPKGAKDISARTVINKVPGGNDNFYSEVYDKSGKGWAPAFKLGPRKSALGNLPEDESKFPVATWLKRLLSEGVQQFILNSLLIRKASPPGQVRGFKPDGSNLPWVIHRLQQESPQRFSDWISHLQTALPDLEQIRTVERPDDKHRYLVLRYEGGLDIPSWVASDGTLRLLALTLPAYLPEFKGIYLIEEPENGIHPRAVESVFQSLSSVYDAQILMATHSPVILSIAEADQVLCFAKTAQGATDIVLGSEHPALKEWRGETSLGVLFAAGVLGP
jgi:predicted ATPase